MQCELCDKPGEFIADVGRPMWRCAEHNEQLPSREFETIAEKPGKLDARWEIDAETWERVLIDNKTNLVLVREKNKL